jgi:hypothetical protein
MVPNQYDLTVWTAHHLPEWAKRLKRPPQVSPALHGAINLRASLEVAGCEPSNACVVLRLVRKRGEPLLSYMARASREYALSQPRRSHTYRRWLRRAHRA